MGESRIKEISFRNFRVFKEDTTIKFEKNGKILDFICIYGQNGMGKTSIFDGIEWLKKNKISRLEFDLTKEQKRNIIEKGSHDKKILRNIYSGDDDIANVTVTSSDNKQFSKSTNKRGKSDYIGSSDKGEENILENIKILPYAEIEKFMTPKNPTELFNEFTRKIHDGENIEKEFQNLHILKRKVEKEKDANEKQIGDLKNKKSNIEISAEEICYLNTVVRKINGFLEKNKINFDYLREITYDNKTKKYVYTTYEEIKNILDKIKEIEELLEKNKSKIENNLQKRFYDYLDDLYAKKFLNEKIEHQREVLEKIETLFKNELEVKKCIELEKDIDFIKNNFNNSNKRMSFNNYKKNTKVLIEKENIVKQKDENKKKVDIKVNKLKQDMIKNRSDFSLYKKYKSEIINDFNNKDMAFLEEKKNELNKKLKESKFQLVLRKNIINTTNNSIKQVEDIIKKLQNTNIKKFIDKKLFNEASYELKDKIQIELLNEKILENISELEKSKKELDNIVFKKEPLENNINELKSFILNNSLRECPVCKSKFETVEKLVDKIKADLFDNTVYVITTNIEKLEEVIANYIKVLIDIYQEQYNILYETKMVDCNEATHIEKIIDEILKKVQEVEETIKKYITKRKDLSEKFLLYEFDVSEIKLNKLLSKINKSIAKKFIEIKEQINIKELEVEKELKSLEKEKLHIADLMNDIDIFRDKNKEIISIVELYNLDKENIFEIEQYLDELYIKNKSLINIQKKYSKYKSYFSVINNRQKRFKKKLKDIEKSIKNYTDDFNIIYTGFNLKKVNYINHKYLNELIKINNKLYVNINDLKIKKIERNIIKDIVEKADNFNKEMEIIKGDLENRNSCAEKLKTNLDKITELIKIYRSYIVKELEGLTENENVKYIYSLIEPNKEFLSIKYEIDFNDNDEVELYLVSNNENINIIPSLYFSTGQLNTLAISIFLGEIISSNDYKNKTIFLDDPISSFDDVNMLAFIDLIRYLVYDLKIQIVLSTHDSRIYEMLEIKLSEEYYNSNFMYFSKVGEIKERRK